MKMENALSLFAAPCYNPMKKIDLADINISHFFQISSTLRVLQLVQHCLEKRKVLWRIGAVFVS